MAMNPRLLRPTSGGDSPASIPGLALWLDAAAPDALYQTEAGPVEPADETEIANLTGLEAWWDASDEATVTLDSGRVSSLADKSGNGLDAVNATTGTTQPTYETAARNGLNVVRFDAASTQRLTVASSTATFKFLHDGTDSYIIAVWSAGTGSNPDDRLALLGNNGTSSANTGVFVSYDDRAAFSVNNSLNAMASAGVSGQFVFQAFQVASYGGILTPNQLNCLEMLIDGNNATASERLSVYVNGAGNIKANAGTLAPSASNATFDLQLGCAGNNVSPLTGDICEVLIFSQQPSMQQRARIAKYLANKWGIANVHAPAVTASDPVGYWRDRSGNGRHATQSTAASRPRVASASVNGRRVAEWHSTTSLMQIAGAGALANTMSMFAVAKRGPSNWGGGGGGGYGTILSIGSSSSGPAMRAANGVIGMLGGTNESTFAPSGGLGVTAHALFGGTLNSLASSLYVNGALVDSDAAAGSVGGASNTAIGAFSAATGGGGPLNAELAEIISYNRLLSTAERRKIERYLARRWGITLAPQVSNAEAQDWINRVYAAGSTVSQPVANAVSAFVDGCQADGIWDAMKSVVLLAGADTLAGALAPLKGTAPTSYNFASGDYSKTSGLKGNGSSTYLISNRNNNADPQNSNHNAVYVSETGNGALIGTAFGENYIDITATPRTRVWNRNNGASYANLAGSPLPGLYGASRALSSEYSYRTPQGSGQIAATSSSPASNLVRLFAASNDGVTFGTFSSARLSLYSIGEAVDLALLDARVSALMTAIGVS